MRVYSRCVKKNRKDRHRLSTTEHRTSKRTMRWTCLDRICELRKLQKFAWDAWLIKRFRVVLLLLLRLIRRRDGLPRHNLFNNSGLSTGFRVVERNGMQIKFNPLFSISLLANVPGTGNQHLEFVSTNLCHGRGATPDALRPTQLAEASF